MSWHSIIDATVTLYSWVDRENKQRVCVCAKLPYHDYDNERVDVIDWNIDNGTVHLKYRFSGDAYATIFDTDLPLVTERYSIPRPSPSKNWYLMEYEEAWKNKKTGKKVSI